MNLSAQYRRLKHWLIRKLGGVVAESRELDLYNALDGAIQFAAGAACQKVLADPSFSNVGFSNLGRNIRRDEACEWAKLYLKDQGATYSDSDIHLACELYYRIFVRKTA